MKVTVFSTSNCAICRAEMRWLDEKGIAYDHVIVDEEPDGMQRLMQVSGGAIGVPYTSIEDDAGTLSGVQGFDQAALKNLLSL